MPENADKTHSLIIKRPRIDKYMRRQVDRYTKNEFNKNVNIDKSYTAI